MTDRIRLIIRSFVEQRLIEIDQDEDNQEEPDSEIPLPVSAPPERGLPDDSIHSWPSDSSLVNAIGALEGNPVSVASLFKTSNVSPRKIVPPTISNPFDIPMSPELGDRALGGIDSMLGLKGKFYTPRTKPAA